MLSDSLKAHPKSKLMKNVVMNIKSDEGGDEMSFGMSINYDSKEQRDEISEYMPIFLSKDKTDKQDVTSGITSTIMGEAETIDYKKGIVTIPAQDLSDELGEGLGSDEMDMEDEESKMMIKMLFGDSGMKSTYHLPGPVEFTNDHTAVINGNSVTFNISMMDLMEMEQIPQRIIKYKVK